MPNVRPRTLNRIAVTLITTATAAFGWLGLATAKADDMDPVTYAYATTYAEAVCSTLDEHPTINGVIGIGTVIMGDGFAAFQAGQIVGYAVINECPWHTGLMRAFAARYSKAETKIA